MLVHVRQTSALFPPCIPDCSGEVPQGLERCVRNSPGPSLCDVNTCTSTDDCRDVARQFEVTQAVSNHNAEGWLAVRMFAKPVEDETRPWFSARAVNRLEVRTYLKCLYR